MKTKWYVNGTSIKDGQNQFRELEDYIQAKELFNKLIDEGEHKNVSVSDYEGQIILEQ